MASGGGRRGEGCVRAAAEGRIGEKGGGRGGGGGVLISMR